MVQRYVIIGSGIAGVTAAEILRSEDATAEISVITDDPYPPYYRPALKDYLAGRVREDKLWSRPMGFYQELQIRLLVGRAVAIQVGQHMVQLQDGQQIGYSRLLVACGASASRLTCPGSDLVGVRALRTVADYQQVQQRLSQVRRIVVSGSGTLALETIETLRHRGYEVTHLLRKRVLWSEVLDPTASDLVLQQERRDGVDVRIEEEIAEIIGKDGQAVGIVTSSGARLACEMVIMAIGIEPALSLLQKSGIPCGKGARVDLSMRTGAPDVYAAGDVLETLDSTTGRTRVLGQWYPAIQQAKAAAYSMLDRLDSSQSMQNGFFYNATSLYGLDLAVVGLTHLPNGGQGYQEIVAEPQPRVYRKVILKDGRAIGMLSLGSRRGGLAFKRAIDHAVNLQPIIARIFDSDFDLGLWLDQQGVLPARLNVSRSSEIGHAKDQVGSLASEEVWLVADTDTPASDRPATTAAARLLLDATRVMTVGRQEGTDLLIDHASISRRHAEIGYREGQYELRDMGSSNGTFIHGVRLETRRSQMLQNGDQVRFGQVDYLFQVKARAASSQLATQVQDTTMHGLPTGFYDPTVAELPPDSRQPVLNAQGELVLPGATRSIPARVVATFQDSPVLISVQSGIPVVFPLSQQKRVSVGREKSNDLILSDMAVSRHHAEIIPGPDGFSIRDLASSSGVIVNQTRIDNPYHLTHGDRFQIGGAMIYFLDQLSTNSERSPDSPTPKNVCRTCNTSNNAVARFCTKCGAPLEQAAIAAQERGGLYAGR